MTHVTCRLTAKNRDQLRNPTLGNRVWSTCFTRARCGLLLQMWRGRRVYVSACWTQRWAWALQKRLNRSRIRKNYTQAVSVRASHPHWTGTSVPVRLCIRSFCTQCTQIAAEVDWLSGLLLPRTRTRFGERGFSCCGPAAWNTPPSDLHDIS